MEKLDELRLDKYKNVKAEQMDSKYQAYSGFYGIASGTVFMGFFLGIAFLAMMASRLMFKNSFWCIKRYYALSNAS